MSEWIDCRGRDPGLKPLTKVNVRFADGDTNTDGLHAGGWYFGGSGKLDHNIVAYQIVEPCTVEDNPLNKQEGGKHYKDMAIQPVEFVHKNNIPYIEGCVIKYVCRWKKKNGVEDLKKAKHFLELLIEMEEKAS